jgi:hypothetical protein
MICVATKCCREFDAFVARSESFLLLLFPPLPRGREGGVIAGLICLVLATSSSLYNHQSCLHVENSREAEVACHHPDGEQESSSLLPFWLEAILIFHHQNLTSIQIVGVMSIQ